MADKIMGVPLADKEVIELGLDLVALREFLEQVVASLPPDSEDRFDGMAREALRRMERVCELIGRAAFVRAGEAPPKETLQ